MKGYSINKIGIIGAGLMASQMALLFAQRFQCPVVMKDIKQEFVDKGLAYVRDQLGKRVKRAKWPQPTPSGWGGPHYRHGHL